MARVDLSDSLHGPVWVCQTTTFSESADEREWGTFLTHEGFSTRSEAREWASHLANDYMDVLLRLIGAEGSTGISVDVQPRVYDGENYEPHPITDSWEVIPDRPVDEWHLADDPFRTYEGRAYAVLEADGTLTLFRSNDRYEQGSSCRTLDLAGVERRGVVWDCPEALAGDRDLLPGWHSRAAEIRRVSLAEGQAIRPISCSGWFAGCESLESADLSEWDTSELSDLDLLFFGCKSLAVADLSGWDVSRATALSHVFAGCSSLETLDLSGWDTANATNMLGTFSGCESLTSLDLSGWDVSHVTYLHHMFDGCTSLESLDLSAWDTSSAVLTDHMFLRCESLRSLDLSSWDVSHVTDMRLMFAGCRSLESLDLSSWDVSRVENMIYLFSECNSLKDLDLSKWEAPNVDWKDTYSMFFGCDSMGSPSLPEGSAIEEAWFAEQATPELDER